LNDAVVNKLPVSIGVELTLTANVDVSPFVKVIVLPTADAVTNAKLAEVNKLAVAEFNEEVTLAKVVSFVSCEAVKLFNAVMSVVTALPVLTIMLNVDASPFVNVIVLRFTDAVTNELAVIADVT
jgi:uncharacterized protein YggT (Ycf19 family)